jgi:UDP-glucose 4-epimerase
MKALITGAAGFIGSNLVDHLIGIGWDVVGIDNESSLAHDQFYYNPKASYVPKEQADISTEKPWKSLANEKFDYVFHMGAECRIQQCIENPALCISTNILGTVNTLDYAAKNGVKRFVMSSTSSVYSGCDYMADENEEPICINPYSSTKLSGEVFCKQYSMTTELDTVILRYFNVYGERHTVRGSYAPVIGVFQRQLKDNSAFTIVGDGEQRRDFVHVLDVAKANVLAAQNSIINNRLNAEVFNIGTGVNYSVNEVADLISTKNTRVNLPSRSGETRITLCDYRKARDWLGWSPSIKLSDWIVSVDNMLI